MLKILLLLQQFQIENSYQSEEPLSFYMKRQLEFEKECRLLNIDINSAEAQQLRKTCNDANNNVTNAFATNNEVMLLILMLTWIFI